MRIALAALVPLALAACAKAPEPRFFPPPPFHEMSADGVSRAEIGERAYVDGLYITPLKVLEDSRCPIDVQCVWRGQVRLSIRIELDGRSETREIASYEPLQIADGELTLVETVPYQDTRQPFRDSDYRFGFTFAGGI